MWVQGNISQNHPFWKASFCKPPTFDDLPLLKEIVRESFVSQERVSGFPEKGADLRGSCRNTSGKFGELREVGKLSGNLWIAVKFHSERTSGEVAETLPGSSGNFRGCLGTFQKLVGARLSPSDSPNLSPISAQGDWTHLRECVRLARRFGHEKVPEARQAFRPLEYYQQTFGPTCINCVPSLKAITGHRYAPAAAERESRDLDRKKHLNWIFCGQNGLCGTFLSPPEASQSSFGSPSCIVLQESGHGLVSGGQWVPKERIQVRDQKAHVKKV